MLDVVCGMRPNSATTPHHCEHDGETYWFCGAGCRTKFVADPEKYLTLQPEAPPPPPGTIYTCPMDPEVRQIGPGVCPKCGMALEPARVSADDPPNPEIADFTRRLWVGGVLAAPLLVVEMGGHLTGLHLPVSAAVNAWGQFALATPVVWWAGWPFLERGWASILRRSPNMFTLIAMGVLASWVYSTVATAAPGLLPMALGGMHGAPPLYFEAAAVIVVLVLLGQLLELRAREQTSGALRSLLRLAPRSALRVRSDGTDETVEVSAIAVGDHLRVRPGEALPVDGRLIEGAAEIDESLVTGESMPVAKAPGDAVVAGSRNTSGSFVMQADKVGAETLLARIVEMVAEAQRSRAPIQRLADQVSGWFVPTVAAVAALAFAAWMIWGPQPAFSYALVAAVSVLIIACPCALGLATPMSIMVGVGRGAQGGVLLRSAEAIERFERVDVLLVDKTGTLTEGRPALREVVPASGFEEADVLGLAASLERGSEHPLARAINEAAAARGLIPAPAEGFTALAGLGVSGQVGGRPVRLGSASLLSDAGVDAAPLAARADALRGEGASVVFLAVEGRLAGLLAVADPIRSTTPEAIRGLRDAGVRLIMVTGDHRTTAMAVAGTLGLDEVEAGATPAGKAALVRRLQAEGHVVAVAGDGVNDAPALAAADVGVAMGAGSDVALETAGVTLLQGDLRGIARARRLSKAVMDNIRQNLAFAFLYNAAGVPVAAGLLYPAFGLTLSPALAAAAMAASSLSVVGNALRLRGVRL